MKERVCRENDEATYQPKIHKDRISELYKIGMETGLPMTVLVDYALRSYVKAYNEDKEKTREAIIECEFRMDEKGDDQQERDIEEAEHFNDGTMYGF